MNEGGKEKEGRKEKDGEERKEGRKEGRKVNKMRAVTRKIEEGKKGVK